MNLAPLNIYPCCGAPRDYVGDPHRWNCHTARTYGLRREQVLAEPAKVLKCTCGSGNRPLKGAGHSDWCDVETSS